MSLIAPAWLSLAALGFLVLILHVRRRRTLEVPSIQLWRLLGSGALPGRRIRLPSPSLLLLLQLLIVALAALALARPVLDPGGRFVHEIVVLDASGSMRSTDVVPSRFDAAVTHLAVMAAGPIRETGARVSVVLAGARPQILGARLADPGGLELRGLRAGDGEVDWVAVISLLSSLVKDNEPTRLTLITDGADPARLSAALPGVIVEVRMVGNKAAANAALHASLRAIDAPAGKWRAEGDVAFPPGFVGSTTVTALVQPEGSAGFLQWGSVEVGPPGGAAAASGRPSAGTFALDLDVRVASVVVLRLPNDSGPHDNAANFVVHPKPRVLNVLQLGAVNEPLTRALKAAAEIELFAADTLPADVSAFDLVVVNGIEIARHPKTNVLWLGAARAAGEPGGQLRGGAQPAQWQSEHPLSRSILWSGVTIGAAYRFSHLQGAEAIVEAGDVPLIEARTTLAGREVRLAFDISRSNWPDEPSFPIFVSNLLHWIAPDLGRTVEPPCIVGASCVLDPRLFGAEVVPVTVRTDPASATGLERSTPVLPAIPYGTDFLPPGYDTQFIPDRAGIYRLQRDSLMRFIAVNPGGSEAAPPPPNGTPPAASIGDGPQLRWRLLAALLGLLLAEAWLAGRGSERFLRRTALAGGNPLAARRRFLLAARLAALSFMVLAIADAPLLLPDRSRNIAVVMAPNLGAGNIASRLTDRIYAAAERDRASGGNPRLAFVTIGANGHVAADLGAEPGRDRAAEPSSPPLAADLENALAVAAAMVPADAPGQIVVASDGNETRGNAARLLPAIVRRGVKVDVLPMSRLAAGEVLVEKVTAPERVYAGDTFALEAVIYSHGPSSATIEVLRDGEVIVERPLELVGGRSRIETIVPAASPGRARYEVAVSASGDTFVQNNRNGVVIDVAPAPQVLIVAAQPAWAELFAKALAVQDIKTRIVEPKRAPFYIKDWLAYSAIVLMNVPAIDLATLQQELIEKAVADHGRGLLLLGGENSFGPGGYYETPLERVSPLSSRVPRDAPRVALAFVLDRSGSMQRSEGGATRLDIAKQATISAIGLLHPESLIAIVVFDSEAKVLLPLRPAKDSASVTQALQGLEPGGGTAIYPGLVEALHQLQGVDAMAKHIVVMSDGLTQPGDFPGILKAISNQGISVSTVAIGDGADPVRLEEIARMGKGAFHATQDFKALPSILSQEALLLSGKPVEERSATPLWVGRNAQFFAGAQEKLPPLGGYVLTTRKPAADLHLVVPDEKQEPVPLLASWRYGNGRVVALTTQVAGTWTAEWQAMAEYPLLWSQIVRHVLSSPGEGLVPRLARHGDKIEVEVDALSPEGMPREGIKITASLTKIGSAAGIGADLRCGRAAATPSSLVAEGRGVGCGNTVPSQPTPTPNPSPAEPRYSEGSATLQSDRSRQQPTSVGGGEQPAAPRELNLASESAVPPPSISLSEVSPGRYQGAFTLDHAGEFNLHVAADQATAEAPLFVAYPALHEFTRADPRGLAALAAATGGQVLASEEQIFAGGQSRWVTRAAWQVWVLAALALFLADLIVRYGSGLISPCRRSAP
jgi:Mg-chelatase subunit ChlD